MKLRIHKQKGKDSWGSYTYVEDADELLPWVRRDVALLDAVDEPCIVERSFNGKEDRIVWSLPGIGIRQWQGGSPEEYGYYLDQFAQKGWVWKLSR